MGLREDMQKGFTAPMPEGWTPQQEQAFMNWYRPMAMSQGLNLDPSAPQHMYDMRGFYQSGMNSGPDVMDVGPTGPRTHFPDEFKLPGHPNLLWSANNMGAVRPMEGMQQTGSAPLNFLMMRGLR